MPPAAVSGNIHGFKNFEGNRGGAAFNVGGLEGAGVFSGMVPVAVSSASVILTELFSMRISGWGLLQAVPGRSGAGRRPARVEVQEEPACCGAGRQKE